MLPRLQFYNLLAKTLKVNTFFYGMNFLELIKSEKDIGLQNHNLLIIHSIWSISKASELIEFWKVADSAFRGGSGDPPGGGQVTFR